MPRLVVMMDGKRYLGSRPPTPYQIDMPAEADPAQYTKQYQNEWAARQPYLPMEEANKLAEARRRDAGWVKPENMLAPPRDYVPEKWPTPPVTRGSYADLIPKTPKRVMPAEAYAREVEQGGRDIDKFGAFLPADTAFDKYTPIQRRQSWGGWWWLIHLNNSMPTWISY